MAGTVGIYKIVSPTGRVYIGQSINISRRFQKYRYGRERYQRKLYRSFKKYGVTAHSFEVIHQLPTDVSKEVIDAYEKLYIDQFSSVGFKLLNIKEGGSRGKASQETKIRQSIALKGRIIKDLPIKSIAEAFLQGIWVSNLAKQHCVSQGTLTKRLRAYLGAAQVERVTKQRKQETLHKAAVRFQLGGTPWNKGVSMGGGTENNFYGKFHNDESKSKMRAAKEKAVICLSNGKEYQSAIAAASELGLQKSSVAKVARGFQKQHKGFVFKYL